MTPATITAIRAAEQGMQLLRALRGGDHGQDAQTDAARVTQFLGRHGAHEGAGAEGAASETVTRASRRPDSPSRFPRSQTHKASSAESILSHCLKQRGFTARWKADSLTDRQRLRLLEDVRLYGRAWLRHEAEQFFRSYSGGSERATTKTARASTESTASTAATGSVSPIRRFFARAKQFVRELIHAGVMAIMGTTNLDAIESAEADQAADNQARFFDGFESQVQSPQAPTPGRAIARTESYADSAWQASQQINHRAHTGANGRPPRPLRSGNPARWERRVLGHPKTEHCHDCPLLADLGWQPIGTLPAIGDSECGHLCLCHFEYSDAEVPPVAKPGGSLEQLKVKKPKKLALKGSQEAIDKLLSNPQFNAAMKELKITMKVQVGKSG